MITGVYYIYILHYKDLLKYIMCRAVEIRNYSFCNLGFMILGGKIKYNKGLRVRLVMSGIKI